MRSSSLNTNVRNLIDTTFKINASGTSQYSTLPHTPTRGLLRHSSTKSIFDNSIFIKVSTSDVSRSPGKTRTKMSLRQRVRSDSVGSLISRKGFNKASGSPNKSPKRPRAVSTFGAATILGKAGFKSFKKLILLGKREMKGNGLVAGLGGMKKRNTDGQMTSFSDGGVATAKPVSAFDAEENDTVMDGEGTDSDTHTYHATVDAEEGDIQEISYMPEVLSDVEMVPISGGMNVDSPSGTASDDVLEGIFAQLQDMHPLENGDDGMIDPFTTPVKLVPPSAMTMDDVELPLTPSTFHSDNSSSMRRIRANEFSKQKLDKWLGIGASEEYGRLIDM